MAFRHEPVEGVHHHRDQDPAVPARRLQYPEPPTAGYSEPVDQYLDDSVRASHSEERERSAHLAGSAAVRVLAILLSHKRHKSTKPHDRAFCAFCAFAARNSVNKLASTVKI